MGSEFHGFRFQRAVILFQIRATDMFICDDVRHRRSGASLGYRGIICDLEHPRTLFAADSKRFRALIDRRNFPMKWDWARGLFGGGEACLAKPQVKLLLRARAAR